MFPVDIDNDCCSLQYQEVCERRRDMLCEPHMTPLNKYVETLRNQNRGKVPDFDPLDGGIKARALFLMEKPGPMANESGFISRNNNDATAAITCMFMKKINVPRERTILWNVIPWWNENTKVNSTEERDDVAHVNELIQLLVNLRAIVLVGEKAQAACQRLDHNGLTVFKSYHPSPQVMGTKFEKWKAIPSEWARVKRVLDLV